MLILVSSLSAPSGISIEASPSFTVPPVLAEIKNSDFSSFETETARDTGFETALSSSAKAATGLEAARYKTAITAATIFLLNFISVIFSELFIFLHIKKGNYKIFIVFVIPFKKFLRFFTYYHTFGFEKFYQKK